MMRGRLEIPLQERVVDRGASEQAQCLVSMVTPERVYSGIVTSLEHGLLEARDGLQTSPPIMSINSHQMECIELWRGARHCSKCFTGSQ